MDSIESIMNTTLNRTFRGEMLITNPSTSSPVRLTARTIIDISRVTTQGSGNKRVVVEFDAAHGYSVGTRVYISGCDEAEFNTATLKDNFGQTGALVMAVPTTTTIVLLLEGSSGGATLTAPECYADIWVRQATLIGKKAARTSNASTVYIGGKSVNDQQPYGIEPDAEAFLPAGREGVGPLVNLADWYLDVTTNDDGLYVFYF